MAYSAIYDRLHFHFDIGNPTSKILPLLSDTRRLVKSIDQNESVIDGTCIWLNKPYLSSNILRRTRTATRSCRARKRAFYFYSPGVVRLQVPALLYDGAATAASAAAAVAAVAPPSVCKVHRRSILKWKSLSTLKI